MRLLIKHIIGSKKKFELLIIKLLWKEKENRTKERYNAVSN